MKKAQVFFAFATFLAVLLSFQNCSAPLQEEGAADGSSTSSYAKGINFAFDTSVDQIAYMSCHQLGSNFDRSTYFSFRVGGYEAGGGTNIRNQFLNETAGMAKDIQKNMLVTSPSNAGAQPVLSIRNPDQAQQPYAVNRVSPTYGVDHALMFGVLTNDPIANKLLENPSQRLRYQRDGVNVEGLRVEGSLYVNDGINGLNSAQSTLTSSGGLVAVNYAVGGNDKQSVRGPARYFSGLNNINSVVYGKGLRLTFKRHPSSPSTNPPWLPLISSVDQVDMETRTESIGYMSCPAALVFKVVDRRHLASSPCDMKADNPAALSAQDQEYLRRARLSLRVEDWYIDWARKCIVNKKTDISQNQCYGPNSSTIQVEYDLTKYCDPSPATSVVKACAAFASICLR